jgi:hypothetical protein
MESADSVFQRTQLAGYFLAGEKPALSAPRGLVAQKKQQNSSTRLVWKRRNPTWGQRPFRMGVPRKKRLPLKKFTFSG